jgi:hypothetical protein
MSEESKRRDFGIAFAAAGTAVLEFLIFAIGSAWPDAVWRSSMTDTALLIPVLTFVGSLVAATFMRSHPQVAEVTVGVVIAVALYASVQGVSYYDATNDERQAEQAAAQWPVALSQDFSHVTGWNPNSSQPSSFGTLQTTVVNGQFLIRLTSERDESGLVSPDGRHQPVVSDFFLQADVTYVQGPKDGDCVLVFGETVSEHWWAVKIGHDFFAVTQDDGGLPHRYIDGPNTTTVLRDHQLNRVAILKQGSQLKVFLNNYLVDNLQYLDIPAGKIWIGPQAATTRDLVQCVYGNIVLRGTPG